MLLGDHLNSTKLKSFSINGLFGFKNVKIPFEKEAVILIAENGSGKTTILNALYYSISCNFHKLSAIDFDSVVLEFESGVSVDIKKSDLKLYDQHDIFQFISLLRPYLLSREIDRLKMEIKKGSGSELVRRDLFKLIAKYNLPSRHMEIAEEISLRLRSDKERDQKSKIDKIIKTIQENLNFSLY